MTVTKAAIMELVKRILQEHAAGRSYRAIAASYPTRPDGTQIVKAGTLNRIVNEAGEWLPKDKEILQALGLIEKRVKDPQPEWLVRRKKAIRKMVKETKQAVIIQKGKNHEG